ncbi:MAG: hypothetical protein ACI9XC_000961 [Gammaproteobacteria bacterium]|jgi:hypothetical protein
MTISMYQASIPVCIRALTNLDNILRKGEAFAADKNIEQSILLNSHLAIDMLPLTKQVQIASDVSKGLGARLSDGESPKYEDNEQSFAELYARIHKTVEYVSGIKPEQIDGSEEKIVVIKLPNQELKFRGIDYLLGFALPNIIFHVSTAYNILRHNGVELGKKDFLGDMPML